MGLFSKILEKLGIGKDKDAAASAPATTAAKPAPAPVPAPAPRPAGVPAPKPATPAAAPNPAAIGKEASNAALSRAAAPAPVAPKPVSEVDVVKHLETLAKGKGLNWKVSIVDLLTLLDIDHSREARIELAKELGCPEELMGGDLAKMNVWLHKTVLRKIAENGGNIPADLLD